MHNIRTLVVDDEPLARDKIKGFLSEEPDIELVAECDNGLSAVSAIRDKRPDLVFLDVQMPELNGFGVLKEVGDEDAPAVIFVTAFDQYALQAFDVHAMDFLLKPFDRARFRTAVDRARSQIVGNQTGHLRDKLSALLEDLEDKKYLDRLVVKARGRVYFLKVGDVDWIEAAANYVKLHTGMESHTVRETMSNLETRLDPNKFMRIHRSTIVNIDRIEELRQLFHGDYAVVLKGGKSLAVSRGYREKLNTLLGKPS